MIYSITIPAYKANFLSKCIDSILAQTYENFELIIVNDASPEDLDSIVNSYSDKRIKYYTNEKNCGAENLVDNWNICLSYASGDYVICMGDDDELAPNCLAEYNLLMEQYPDLDLYHASVKQIDEESNLYSLQCATPSFETVYSMIWHKMQNRDVYIGDYLFKRSSLISNGGYYKIPLAWGSDNISTYIAASNKGVANTSTPVFYYRVNRLSITSSINSDLKLQAWDEYEKWLANFISNNVPVTNLDNDYHELIRRNLCRYFERMRMNVITKDIANSNYIILRTIYWLRNRKKINVSYYKLIKASLIGIVNKINS